MTYSNVSRLTTLADFYLRRMIHQDASSVTNHLCKYKYKTNYLDILCRCPRNTCYCHLAFGLSCAAFTIYTQPDHPSRQVYKQVYLNRWTSKFPAFNLYPDELSDELSFFVWTDYPSYSIWIGPFGYDVILNLQGENFWVGYKLLLCSYIPHFKRWIKRNMVENVARGQQF